MIKITDGDVVMGGFSIGEIDLPIQDSEYRVRLNPNKYAIHINSDDLRVIADHLDEVNQRRYEEGE